MKNYTISVSQNTEPNTVGFSAYCKEWDIIAEQETIPQVLSELFAAIQILESEQKEKVNFRKYNFRKNIDFQVPIYA